MPQKNNVATNVPPKTTGKLQNPFSPLTHLRHQTATKHPQCLCPASSGTAGWPPAASGRSHSKAESDSSCLGIHPESTQHMETSHGISFHGIKKLRVKL